MDVSCLTVICSPFMRCVETGIEICKVFGCDMMIDQAWGEVMSPDLFGGDKTIGKHPTRELKALVNLALAAKVEVKNTCVFLGDKPVYPETVDTARSRYGKEFQSSLERSQSTQRSFIIVTHGEALPVCLSFFENPPALMGQVPYGAYFIGSWVAEEDLPPESTRAPSDHADDESTAWVAFKKMISLEKLTLPLCPTQVTPSTDSDATKNVFGGVGRVSSWDSAEALSKEVPFHMDVPSPHSAKNGSEDATAKPEALASVPLDMRWKRTSPTNGTLGGLAARRRLRHVPLDLGGDLGDPIGSPSALVAAG
jgi:hypothetical protein